VKSADVVLSVHPDVWLYSYAKKLGKAHAVCWNGWDSASDQSGVDRALPADIQAQLNELKKYWVYVGRGGDRVKAVDRLQGAMRLVPDLNWVAAPGDGFETSPRVLKTGSLNNAQVRELMTRASGLALCSRYEGNPLVVLEALALGTPVVATRVGAIPSLSEDIQGLVTAEGNPYSLADSIRAAGKFDPSGRQARAEANQKLLPTWEKVAAISLQAVQDLLSSRGAARV
jgi:glycosyltransferase involved in cell wall biosynthesis